MTGTETVPPPIEQEAVPPCIRALHARLAAGENVSHRGRLAFASFMLSMGVDEKLVAQQFSRTPNHDPSKTMRIVRDLRERKNLPQSCKTMQADGLCNEGLKETLCRSIRNPISWGRIRTGTVIAGPRITDNEDAIYIITCACGKLLGPIQGAKQAQALASFHFWSVPVDDEDRHLSMEYVVKETKTA